MTWIITIAAYFGLVWLFLKFFGFVAGVDREIEQMQEKEKQRELRQSNKAR